MAGFEVTMYGRFCVTPEVLDERLPNISGLEVLKQIKAIKHSQAAIILTGFPNSNSEVTSKETGAIAYVSKGERNLPEVLRAQVEKLVALYHNPIRVFLSYEQTDLEKVTALYNRLKDNGYTPWRDKEDLLPGQQWEHEIKKAIKESEFFVACLSSTSSNKRGVIPDEFQQAWIRQNRMLPGEVYLIPARLDTCEVPEPFNNLQYVDLFGSDWFSRLEKVLLSRNKLSS